MNAKFSGLFLLVIFLISIVSATLTSTVPVALSNFDNSTTFTVTSTENVTITVPALVQIFDSDNHPLEVSLSADKLDLNTTDGLTATITAEYISLGTFDPKLGEIYYSEPFNIYKEGNESNNVSVTLSFEKSFCEVDNPADMGIRITDINVEEGFGDEDDFWYLFDEVEVEVEVEPGKWDIQDIEVEWELYSTNGQKIMDEDEKDFDLDKDDDEETLTFTFKLDEDIDEFEGEDAILYVRATGKIDDEDARADDGKNTCNWDSKQVEVVTEDHFVILDDIQMRETAECGSELDITADVWNIGEKQEDDVYVIIYNGELGINEKKEIGDIDEFEDEKMSLTVIIPKDAKEGSYTLELMVFDEDDEIFENDEGDEAKFRKNLMVEGNCKVEQEAEVIISASLDPADQSVIPGREVSIKAILTNTGEAVTDYQIILTDYEDWASSANVEPATITIEAGETGEAIIFITPNKDALGEKQFTIQILYNGLIKEQEVQLTIGSAGILTGWAIGEGFRENWFIWTIAALNILLVLIIIIIAARIARKSSE